ncbi:MAG: DUF2079 domain-containing protein [Clostridia bacterium]|nr:DUF2079 domain-containing protein [Clostridia bacterium]
MIKRAVSAWLFAAMMMLIFLPGSFTSLNFAQGSEIYYVFLIAALVFLGLTVAEGFVKSELADNIVLTLSVLGCALLCVRETNDVYFLLGITAGCAVLLWHMMDSDRLKMDSVPLSKRAMIITATALGLFFALYIGLLTSLRYLTYSTPNFDFGIFCNMFFNMKETLLPNVTCERDGLLSHFAVHVSPIYYLLLPFYMIFPSPLTLEIGQAVILASGVIPVVLLCRHLKMSNKATVAFAAIYVFFPALAGGCFYDLHENKFLAPLILWLMYFIEKKQEIPTYIFMMLVLFVKEDAPVYIMFIALYMLIHRKEYRKGIIMMAVSVLYFLGVTSYLANAGDGVMTYRYDNFIADSDAGLIGVIKTVLVNPALVFFESFNPDKLKFMILTLVPLGFMPFLTRKTSRLILVLPYILINLMSDYQYQHSIFFQYTYASCALLFYLAILNASELSHAARKALLIMTMTASVLFFTSQIADRDYYINTYKTNRDNYAKMNEALEIIPDDASVKASTFLVPKLSQRFEIYDISTVHDTEYAAVDLRSGYNAKASQQLEQLENEGFEFVVMIEDLIAVLKIGE